MFVFSVCRLVSRRCHRISAILTLASVAVKPLPEPDKQISHIQLLVESSERLKSTTRVEIPSDSCRGYAQEGASVQEPLPGVCMALAFPVDPFEQHFSCEVRVGLALAPILGYFHCGRFPKSPCSSLAWIPTLPLCNSMLSETPGRRWRLVSWRLHLCCLLQPRWYRPIPIYIRFSGLRFRFRAYTLHLVTLTLLPLVYLLRFRSFRAAD